MQLKYQMKYKYKYWFKYMSKYSKKLHQKQTKIDKCQKQKQKSKQDELLSLCLLNSSKLSSKNEIKLKTSENKTNIVEVKPTPLLKLLLVCIFVFALVYAKLQMTDCDARRNPVPAPTLTNLERDDKCDNGMELNKKKPPQNSDKNHQLTLRQFKHRGIKRWSALLTSKRSRIGSCQGIKPLLGKHWQSFVDYANRNFRPTFLTVFSKELKCVGKLGWNGQASQSCENKLCLNPGISADLPLMKHLHLDHIYDVNQICDTWKQILQEKQKLAPLTTWDDGINGDLLCQLLFGVTDHPRLYDQNVEVKSSHSALWQKNLHLRCGASNNKQSNITFKSFCHHLGKGHYAYTISVKDLRATKDIRSTHLSMNPRRVSQEESICMEPFRI
jgi:hypothetical protein